MHHIPKDAPYFGQMPDHDLFSSLALQAFRLSEGGGFVFASATFALQGLLTSSKVCTPFPKCSGNCTYLV